MFGWAWACPSKPQPIKLQPSSLPPATGRSYVWSGLCLHPLFLMPSASRQDWVPRLSDLGISRLCPELAVGQSHVTSRLMGTAGYIAPELMQSMPPPPGRAEGAWARVRAAPQPPVHPLVVHDATQQGATIKNVGCRVTNNNHRRFIGDGVLISALFMDTEVKKKREDINRCLRRNLLFESLPSYALLSCCLDQNIPRLWSPISSRMSSTFHSGVQRPHVSASFHY